MNSNYRIHLRRPWRFEVTGDRLRWTRHFNRPSGLGPGQQVWLLCEGFAGGPLGVTLNGQPLGTLVGNGAAGEFEVAGCLALHNEVVLEGANPSRPTQWTGDQPPGEVCLEIRAGLLQ